MHRARRDAVVRYSIRSLKHVNSSRERADEACMPCRTAKPSVGNKRMLLRVSYAICVQRRLMSIHALIRAEAFVTTSNVHV